MAKAPAFLTYQDKLCDSRWLNRRWEILERDNYECQRCHNDDLTLHVHHLRYVKNHEPWEYQDEDLITLCESCHKAVTICKLSEEDIHNPWLAYERAKKELMPFKSPREYEMVISDIISNISL